MSRVLKLKRVKNEELYNIYPLTIVKDRFNGTYSGGKFVAWNCDISHVPKDTQSRDAFFAWNDIDEYPHDYSIYGVGDTPNEACADLLEKLKDKDN